MRSSALVLLALLVCATASARSNFVSNPYLPYPPGCAFVAGEEGADWLDTQAVKFFDQIVELPNVQTGYSLPVQLEAFRTPCSEPNRSLVWLRFSLAEPDEAGEFELVLPAVVGEYTANWRKPMHLAAEPNGWKGGWSQGPSQSYLVGKPQGYGNLDWYPIPVPDPRQQQWLFLLDSPTLHDDYMFGSGLTAEEYNSRFTLILRNDMYDILSFPVPATTELWPEPPLHLPLSGRLSGTWVVDGAADQGFQLAISEQVGPREEAETDQPELPLVVFISQYTFDADGNPLWLVGSSEFEPGATEVIIAIQKVSGGVFRGDARATRETIGSVKLTANSCDDLGFEYEFSALGLGSGEKHLRRLFSLEVAGYECRDYDARVAANR